MACRLAWLLGALVFVFACRSPATPSETLTPGRPTVPASDAVISFYEQPITLTATPSMGSASSSLTTFVEVATDTGFTSIVMTKPAVANTSGSVTVTLDRLEASTTYYWRVKTTTAGSASAVSSVATFSIGPRLVVDAPVVIAPAADALTGGRPVLSVANARRTGPAATLTYTFDVSRDAAFFAIVASGATGEGASRTSFPVPVDLESGRTYYWRVRATDAATGVSSPYSSSPAFTIASPTDGQYRYTLVVRVPTWCLTHSTQPPPDVMYSTYFANWETLDFGFDGLLVVAGETLRYRVATPPNYVGTPEIALQRTGNQLTGTTRVGMVIPGEFKSLALRGTLTGTSDNQGRFDGKMEGDAAHDVRPGIPGTGAAYCSTRDIAWTLLPHGG